MSLPESGAGLWSSEVNTWISNKFHRGQVPSHPLAKYKVLVMLVIFWRCLCNELMYIVWHILLKI